MKSSMRNLAVLLAVMALVAAACGGDDDGGDAGDGGGDSTTLTISGSSTVEPISARVGEAFNAANPSVGVTVEGPGTGDGFRRFCAGETEVSDASRPIKDSEAENCASEGINFVELKVAFDGLTVMTSPENNAVACLDFADMYALIGPESEGFNNWSDASALGAELGGTHSPYPDAPLVITAPGEESGTYDTFVEFVIEDPAEERGQDAAARADYQASANDNVIVENIAGNATSLGWVGYAFYVENADTLKAIDIDGGNGCVTPTDASIADGSYPLSRALYIYVNTDKAAENQALSDFIDYYLSDEGLAAVAAAGYVDLPANEIQATRDAWEASK
ncbi:MAG: phosphate ABC transporter substrate-binding protein PstS family protein [Acidimicrobiia bacterium]|nr:phosphate ABC transporter substrate-binding protein PstS family protein [Acidimicrobiia bacterium]